MESIVLDLQRLATSRESSVTNLLRKAYLVARKLDLDEFSEWTNKELNGYDDDDDVPSYRIVTGEPKGQTSGREVPLIFPNDDINRMMSQSPVREPIAEIENLVAGDSDHLAVQRYSTSFARELSRRSGTNVRPLLVCTRAAFVAILEAVRNYVLEWALDLEQDGILGEGLSFSGEEKDRAAQNNYHVHIENMSNSQIQQGTRESSQYLTVSDDTLGEIQEFVRALKELLSEAGLNESDRSEVDAEIATVEAQLRSPKPKPGILRESLSSIRNIIEGFGGSLLASGVTDQLPVLIAQLELLSS